MYKELVELADNAIKKDPQNFNSKLLDDKNRNSISLTAKTYATKTGVSQRLETTQIEDPYLFNASQWKVKGPMGKGLQMKDHGLHIAFCAGTGVLVFLDLVAYLLLQSTKLLGADQAKQLSNDFQLHLYVSFNSRDSAIGLELCEKMKELND